MKVIKRDGTEVLFDEGKIKAAIWKANERTNEIGSGSGLDAVVETVVKRCIDCDGEIAVETIQDYVEEALMDHGYKSTAKSYILYREQRSRRRQVKTELLKEVGNKIKASNIVNQNANVDELSFGGRKGEASNELMKWMALNNCVSKLSRENHVNNRIYIHDLDSYIVGEHNCMSIPFDKLLAEGFNIRQTDIRPAGSINTAFQLVAVIFQLQSLQQFGGVSATHLDWTMVPYVRKSFAKHYKTYLYDVEEVAEEAIDSEIKDIIHDAASYSIDDKKYVNYNEKAACYALKLTTQELNQAVEGMYHNLNSLQSRSGNQLPFTSINYGTCTLPEGRMVIKALLQGSINGVGKLHRTAIFPCGIFQYMKGVNDRPGTPNYDLYRLALQSTAKRLYPNYANVDWSNNAGYDRNDPKTYFSTMGKRKLQLI